MPVGLMRLWIKTSFSLSNSFAKFSTPLTAIIFPYKLLFVLMLPFAALPLPVVAVLAVDSLGRGSARCASPPGKAATLSRLS